MGNLYCVVRNKGNVIVSIMFNRSNNKYHFVNLTHGHICSCEFNTVDDAIEDMRTKKLSGEIISYYEIK